MGRINFDIRGIQQPVSEPRGVAPGALVGTIMRKGRANAAVGEAVAGVASQGLKVAAMYAEQNKKADMQADASSYEQFKDQTYRNAELQASQTSDPDKIRSIYDKAASDVQDWVSGSTDGVPNIRWRDQIQPLQADADMTDGKFKFMAQARIADASKQVTNTRSARLQAEAEMAGDRVKINEALQMRVDNGTITKEMKDEMLIQSLQRSDKYVASLNVQKIETMPPDMAEYAATLYKETIAEQYPHLDEATRLEYSKLADNAAKNSKYRFERAEREREIENYNSFIDWQIDNINEPVTAEKAQEFGIDNKTVLSLMREEQKRAGLEANAVKAGQAADDVLSEILSFDWSDKNAHRKQLELSAKIKSLPTEYGSYLNTLFSEQRKGNAPDSTEVSKTLAWGEKQISEIIKDAGSIRFKFDPTEEQINFGIARELDVLRDKVKRENMTADDIRVYIQEKVVPIYSAVKNRNDFNQAVNRYYEAEQLPAAMNGPQGQYMELDVEAIRRRSFPSEQFNVDTNAPQYNP